MIVAITSTERNKLTSNYDIELLYNSVDEIISALTESLLELSVLDINDTSKNVIPEETKTLIKKINENKIEINSYKEKNRNFDELISSYNETIEILNEKIIDAKKAYQTSITEINTINDKIDQISTLYSIIDGKEDDIKTAIASVNEINLASKEARLISNMSKNTKKESKAILKSAKETLGIISGKSIAKDVSKQEIIENKAAYQWLILSIFIFVITLIIALSNFNKYGLSLETLAINIMTIPISLSILFFSMRQYVKRKNLADTYAYKRTLALSLTGFKTQIDDSENPAQTEYLLKAISLLTESPLNDLDKKHIRNELKSLEKIRTSLVDNFISTASNTINTKKTEVSSIVEKQKS